MESKRPTGKCAPSRLIARRAYTILTLTLTLAACAGGRYGFTGVEGGDRLLVDTAGAKVLIQVDLDHGYEAAAEFTQTAVLRIGEDTHTVIQSGLDDPFELEVENGESGGQLEILLGFCHSSEKEVCFVDRAVLAIERDGRRNAGSEASIVDMRYRPRPPQ